MQSILAHCLNPSLYAPPVVTGGVKGSYGAGNRINDLSTSLCKIDNWSTSAYTDSAIITLVLMGNSA